MFLDFLLLVFGRRMSQIFYEIIMQLLTSLKTGFIVSITSVLIGCGGANKGAFSDQQICVATVAKTMGKDPSIIKIDSTQGNVVYLSYTRPNDGRYWAYRCKLKGSNVIWASDTGRWRTDQYDSKITFSVFGNELNIYEKYSDGSEGVKTYGINQLGS